MIKLAKSLSLVISEYYYYSTSIFNSSYKFKHESVFINNKLICNDRNYYNGFPSAVYSYYQPNINENSIRVYYVCA